MRNLFKFTFSGILTSIIISLLGAIWGVVNNSGLGKNVYHYSFGDLFVFFIIYLLPIIVIGAILSSYLNDWIIKSIRNKSNNMFKNKYALNLFYYILFGAVVSIIVTFFVSPIRSINVILFGILIGIVYYHILKCFNYLVTIRQKSA